ncbi:M81 family metallopeptidase [Novosphingobium sp.]|uniref:M81 family metallopeptidase n=1 Tax=Novosphingobium sp. TaxID=1874826 RepID=UPI0038BCAB66
MSTHELRKFRIFIGGIATETNTFAPFPTGMSGFAENGLTRNSSRTGATPLSGPLSVFRNRGEADGHHIVESLFASAQPSGITVRSAYEKLRDTILDELALADLSEAGRIDVVLLMLHGAMVAQGYDDCEGDIITRVRTIVPNAVIGIELDPHCHLTHTMVAQADLVVIGKEYPHVDFEDRAHELYDLCLRAASGRIQPVAALIDLKVIGFYPTFDPPMSDIVAEMKAAEAAAPVLSVSIAHGFPWADTADVGTRVLVYSDADTDRAAAVASRFASRLYDLRETLMPRYPDIATSLDKARSLNGRIVLGDFADNPGGGASGDSTFFLAAMLERGVTDAVIGAFWDPLVAQVCADAGTGAHLQVRLGGKCGPWSGQPVDLAVEVMGVVEDHSQGVFGQRQPMGRSVWLRHNGLDIAVCSVRTQVFEPDAFTGLGIRLDDKRLIVVKSSNHYQAGFRPGADHIWHVRSPGTMGMDFATIPYTKRDPCFFPNVSDPWAESGAPVPVIVHRSSRSIDAIATG